MNAKRTLALSAVTGLALGAIVAAQDAPASLAQAPAEAASEPAAAIISVKCSARMAAAADAAAPLHSA